jgi:hypothetical protein
MPASTAAPPCARDLCRAGTFALALLCLGGCAQRPRTPDLALTCNRAAGHHGPERNPVIAIPGILGTRLVARDSVRVVWGPFDRGSADPARPEAARLIALPIGAGHALDGLRDEVEPAGALDRGRLSVPGVPVGTLAYAHMLAALEPAAAPAERRAAALDLQRRALERARRFQAGRDRPAAVPPGVELFLVAGDGQPTPSVVSVDSATGAVSVLGRADGDGTVTRASALMDERQGADRQPYVRSPIPFRHVMFLPAEHLGITQDATLRDNVLYWLLEAPRPEAAP